MKYSGQIIISISAIVTAMTYALAQSPREELTQMVDQFQKTPSNNVLREKIIKLAGGMKPAPVMPDAALRHTERGALTIKSATTKQDYIDAAQAYEQASLIAPWAGDIYRHLGTIYEKVGDMAVASILTSSQTRKTCSSDDRAVEEERLGLHSLSEQYFKWYLLASPDAPDVGAIRQRFELRAREFARWKWIWDQQCCLGCGGIQRGQR